VIQRVAALSREVVLKIGGLSPWAIIAVFVATGSLQFSTYSFVDQRTKLVAETVCTIGCILIMVAWPFSRLERGELNRDSKRWLILISVIAFFVTVGSYTNITGQNEGIHGTLLVLSLIAYFSYMANQFYASIKPTPPSWYIIILFLALFFLPLGSFYLARLASPKIR